MYNILCLASMEVKTENTCDIAQFWHLLSELIHEESGDKQYSFNWKAYIVNENGANMCGTKEAHAECVAATKVKICQFYFKNDARAKSSKVGDAYWEDS